MKRCRKRLIFLKFQNHFYQQINYNWQNHQISIIIGGIARSRPQQQANNKAADLLCIPLRHHRNRTWNWNWNWTKTWNWTWNLTRELLYE